MLSAKPHIMLRYATTSPICTFAPALSLEPVQRNAFQIRPQRKSSFTPMRMHAWKVKPLKKPENG